MILAIYPYTKGWNYHGRWYSFHRSGEEYHRLQRMFIVMWYQLIAIVIDVLIKRFRVIRQPKPRSNFKAWRYKR